MLWQRPTQNNTTYEDAFLLKNSNIVANNEMIIFSNNRNEFYSIDLKTGSLRWKQNINSSVQPTIINNLIFTVTKEGFLIILDSKTGNILRITDLFGQSNKTKSKKIEVKIHNLEGRLIRDLSIERDFPSGEHEIDWDGKDRKGHKVLPGVYLIRINVETDSMAEGTILSRLVNVVY